MPEEEEKKEVVIKEPTLPLTNMDPQSKKALHNDLKKLDGMVSFNSDGMLGFNLFMHIFLIVTRHSKEQYIKEQRKVVHFRRRAFKVKDWNKYAFIVQHELDMERLKYLDIVNFVL